MSIFVVVLNDGAAGKGRRVLGGECRCGWRHLAKVSKGALAKRRAEPSRKDAVFYSKYVSKWMSQWPLATIVCP